MNTGPDPDDEETDPHAECTIEIARLTAEIARSEQAKLNAWIARAAATKRAETAESALAAMTASRDELQRLYDAECEADYETRDILKSEGKYGKDCTSEKRGRNASRETISESAVNERPEPRPTTVAEARWEERLRRLKKKRKP